MIEPLVEVVIPVHRPGRSVESAVASAQPAVQGLPTRVLLVLHNYSLEPETRAQVEPLVSLLRCDDGIPSPSGPRNAGLDAATAPWVFFLDSDDELSPGCLRRLHEVALTTGADVVLPSILGPDGYLGTPLVSSRATRILDVVDDGLFSRSHSFALLRRQALVESGLRFPDGIRAGQDLVLMTQLYTSMQTAMAFDAVYRLIDRGDERVSAKRQPLPDQLAAVRHILQSAWMGSIPDRERRALVRRILSVNISSGWRRKRSLGHGPSARDHAEMRELALTHDPTALRYMSVRDRVTLRFSETPGRLEQLLLHWVFGLVPSSVAGAFSRIGPLLIGLRNWLVRHRRRRAGPVS